MAHASDVEGEMSVADIDRLAMRNTFIFAIAQAFNGAINPLNITLGGLAGGYLLGDDKTLATLPITFFVLGPLIGSMPAAMLMRVVGRRLGFVIGSLIGGIGCAVAAYALMIESFAVFCIGVGLNGVAAAFAQQYRFAAADMGSPNMRTKAISWVMAGGILAAVIGPQMVINFGDLMAPVQFAGAFVGGILLALLGAIAVAFLKFPPKEKQDEQTTPARPLLVIAKQPVFVVAALCAMISFSLMNFVMTAAPLAMVACGFSTDTAALGIQWHVMAMFAPSFFTGNLIVRFGHARIIGAGMALYMLCAVIALMGIEITHFWLSLIALGVGWNFSFIGATSLVTKAYEAHEKNKVQGFFDTLVFGLVAVASVMSGVTFHNAGWNVINFLVFPLAVFCIGLLFWMALRSRRTPA